MRTRQSITARLDKMPAAERDAKLLAAKRAIQQGHGYAAAAEILNVSERYAKKLAQLGDLPRSKRAGFARPSSRNEAIAEDLKAGRSVYATARKFEKSEAHVRAIRNKLAATREHMAPTTGQEKRHD